jgi:hypothetical protein
MCCLSFLSHVLDSGATQKNRRAGSACPAAGYQIIRVFSARTPSGAHESGTVTIMIVRPAAGRRRRRGAGREVPGPVGELDHEQPQAERLSGGAERLTRLGLRRKT